jgi:hypothetical protein
MVPSVTSFPSSRVDFGRPAHHRPGRAGLGSARLRNCRASHQTGITMNDPGASRTNASAHHRATSGGTAAIRLRIIGLSPSAVDTP